jgi:hypothetical protein
MELWHRRMEHLHLDALLKLKEKVDGVELTSGKMLKLCEVCQTCQCPTASISPSSNSSYRHIWRHPP